MAGYESLNYRRGRSGRPYERARAWLKENGDHICWLCHRPINMDLPYNHAWSWTLDHLVPLSKRPDLALDRTNHREAHRTCNSSRGAGTTPTPPKNTRAW